jgi:Ni/Fe-hydrogenase subunit HybB-like protein
MLDPLMTTVLALFAVSAVVMVYRFFTGVGYVSNMTDGFTWGIWEPVNVVVFTGVGAGAYSVALLCYLLGRERYHALVRPTVLLGAICYTLGGSSIMIALGRWWNAVFLPVVPWWNLASALLEVAVCVMSYVFVLWVEVLPSVLDGAAQSSSSFWSRIGKVWGRRLSNAMPYIVALAILLPTMHQSSLGGLMLIAGPKIHPLWHTALLPTLFLISCLSMGYGAVVVLFTILNVTWKAKFDLRLFAEMSKVNAGLLFFYVALRLAEIAWTGKLGLFALDGYTLLFAIELALFLVPAVMFLLPSVRRNRGHLFGAAFLAVLAGSFYRVDTYLSVYRPAPGWDYFPSLGETIVTVGMAAVGVAIFVFVSRKFPVVVVEETRTHPNVAPGRVKVAAGR